MIYLATAQVCPEAVYLVKSTSPSQLTIFSKAVFISLYQQQRFIFLFQVLAGVLFLVMLLTLFIHLRLNVADVSKKKEVVVTSIQLTENVFN